MTESWKVGWFFIGFVVGIGVFAIFQATITYKVPVRVVCFDSHVNETPIFEVYDGEMQLNELLSGGKEVYNVKGVLRKQARWTKVTFSGNCVVGIR